LPVFVGGRRLRLIPVIALAIGLAACGGSSDKPQTLPPLSSTPSTTPSTAPSQTPKAAAVAVVRQYFDLINNLDHDMNADAFIAITTPNCSCRAFAADVRKTAAKGQHYFGTVKVKSATPALDSPKAVEVLTQYNSSRGGTADRNGHVIFRGPRRTGVQEMFFVNLSASGWRVSRINILDKGRRS
jgi:hypothetical protein